MTNALYELGRQAILDDLDWGADTIKVAAIDAASYTPDLNADQFLADIPGGAVKATVTLANKTSTDGVADADDIQFVAVAAFGVGGQIGALVIYKDTGSPATSPLIAWIDDAIGLPVVTNGGDIDVAWDSGANRIFRL